MIVAHRGASQDAPQNTIPAFTLAWEQGADAIEGDFHLTKDGHIVCIHDDNTKKACGTKFVVSKSTLAELRELDAVLKQGYQWHVWTVDDPKTANRMKALGAKSITTNVPDIIRAPRG